MEDLEDSRGAPVTGAVNEPQANKDPQDPLRPEIDEEDSARTPPLADPTADMEGREDNGELGAGDEADGQDAADDNDDLDSELEELDEQEFADFDASALNISTQPMQVDESNVALLGVHKRKRTAEEEAERERKKKKKERKRDKPTRSSRKAGGNDDDFDEGEDADGKRARRSRLGPDGRPAKAVRRQKTPENEENLTPEERKLELLWNTCCREFWNSI
jgi:transcription factor SPN1